MTEQELIQCRTDYKMWLSANYGPKAIEIDLWDIYKAAWLKGKSYGN